MSTRLAKQSLDVLLKSSSASEKRKDRVEKPIPKRLPDTNKGLKKIKLAMRYGWSDRAKELHELQQKKENPFDAIARDEQAIQDNLERNLAILKTSRLKASPIEKKLQKRIQKKMSKPTKSN